MKTTIYNVVNANLKWINTLVWYNISKTFYSCNIKIGRGITKNIYFSTEI